jgi:hypothetical protein
LQWKRDRGTWAWRCSHPAERRNRGGRRTHRLAGGTIGLTFQRIVDVADHELCLDPG